MIRIAIALLFLGTATSAQTVEDEFGTLNPQDTGFGRVMSNIDNGVTVGCDGSIASYYQWSQACLPGW